MEKRLEYLTEECWQASGKSKHIKVDVQSDKTEVQVKPIELPSQADDKVIAHLGEEVETEKEMNMY